MVKDRLHELKQFKEKNGKKDTTSVDIENNTQDDAGSGNKNLRKTFQRAEVIGQWIEQLERNNRDIRAYLRKIEDMQFDQKDVEEKLKSIFQNNTSLAHQLSPKFKEFENELKELKADSAEKRIKTIQFTTSKKRFEKAFVENSKLLENYKSLQKQLIRSQLVAKGYFKVTEDELTSLLEDGTDIQVFTENILAETTEAKRVLANVEERHQQLVQIERMLTEVRDMFVQMSILIDSQQELIDRIEYQAQTATDYVGAGAVDLHKAKKKKKSAFKFKIWIIVALVVLLLVILLIVFH